MAKIGNFQMTQENFSFSITPAALEEMRRQKEKRATPEASLRLGVSGGKCAGFAYQIEWEDSEPKESDHQFLFEEEKILIDKKSIIFLNGSTLDFEKTLMKNGFKFINPQEGSSCGCGMSWSPK